MLRAMNVHRARTRVAAVLLLLMPGPMAGAFAQTTTAVEFDVASVKRMAPALPRGVRVVPGRLEVDSFPLKPLIARAYGVPSWKIVGGPDWITSDNFQIRATMPESTPVEQVNAMLRTLLERRFRLSVARESREMDTDALVLADPNGRLGPGFHPVNVDCETNHLREGSGKGLFPEDARPKCGNSLQTSYLNGAGPRSSKYSALTLDDFANVLSGEARPVLNRTGVTGQFDIALDYQGESQLSAEPGDTTTARATGPSRNEALQEQLGLKLRKERNTVEFLRIRSIEPLRPDEN